MGNNGHARRRAAADPRMAPGRRDRPGARDPLLVRSAGQVVGPEPRPAHRDAAGPAALDWDLWIGAAPMRPYELVSLADAWRGWFDFGSGALGDMAIHNMDPAFYALDLGRPAAVEAKTSPLKPESYPLWTVLRYEFAAKGDRPAVTLTWYDGGKMPPLPTGSRTGTSSSPTTASTSSATRGRWSAAAGRARRALYPESRMQGIPAAAGDDPPLDRPPARVDPGVQGPQAGGRQGGLRLFGPLHRSAAGGEPGRCAPEADRMGRGQHEGLQRRRGRAADSTSSTAQGFGI